jgi:thymidylate kinase
MIIQIIDLKYSAIPSTDDDNDEKFENLDTETKGKLQQIYERITNQHEYARVNNNSGIEEQVKKHAFTDPGFSS